MPYWQDSVVPDLKEVGARGGAVLVVAHGNGLPAIRKYLENIGDKEIVALEIPTGVPYRVPTGRAAAHRRAGDTWGSRLSAPGPQASTH